MRAWEAGRQQKPGAETGQLMKPLASRAENRISTALRARGPSAHGEPDIYSDRAQKQGQQEPVPYGIS